MTSESAEFESIDFALAAFHDDGRWQVEELAHALLVDLDDLAAALRRFPAGGGALGLVSDGEDYFVVMRVTGTRERLLLSDVTAAEEWPFARSVVDRLGLPDPEDDDDPAPAGDLELLADLGLSAVDLALVLDEDLYPDEALARMAEALGFGDLYERALDDEE